jgi:NTP pyrophosphatase (non-canonical NTP hydrolase)
MEFDDYQRAAAMTDQVPGSAGDALVVPLLGMAGEAASLLVEYKKWLRDGEAHRLFRDQIAEELGDLLWYVANLATKFELDLADVAASNLRKTQRRWLAVGPEAPASTMPLLFDDGRPESERFPRQMVAEITQSSDTRGVATATLTIDGRQIGAKLQDNAYEDDGYRFHDVLHLGSVALLGWSPTMRGLLGRKRRTDPLLDNVEDGGRAIVIDEGLAAFVFDYARRNNFLEGVDRVDYELLRTIGNLTSGFEVAIRSPAEWERAILTSVGVWREIRRQGGGRIHLDLPGREFAVVPA